MAVPICGTEVVLERQDRWCQWCSEPRDSNGMWEPESGLFWWRELGETPRGRSAHMHVSTCTSVLTCTPTPPPAPQPHACALRVACSRGPYVPHHRAAPCIHTHTNSGAPRPHPPARNTQHCSHTLPSCPRGQRFPAAPGQVTATGVNTSAPLSPSHVPLAPQPSTHLASGGGSWCVPAAPFWLWGQRW